MNYLSFTLGIISFLFYIFSLQCEKKSNILILQSIANIFYSLQYFLLNALTGAFTAIIAIIKGIVYNHYEKSNKIIPIIFPIIFILVLLIIFYFSYININSILPILINILLILFTYTSNLKHLRINALFCAILWIIYNANVGAYSALMGNILEIISAIISLHRFKGENYD